MAKRVYIKGVRNQTTDNNRLVLAYLLLSRILVEQEEQAERDPTPKPTPPSGGEP
jgi:hypothetical protein